MVRGGSRICWVFRFLVGSAYRGCGGGHSPFRSTKAMVLAIVPRVAAMRW